VLDDDGESHDPERPRVRLTYIQLDKHASAEEIYEYLMERARRQGFPDRPRDEEPTAPPGPGEGTGKKRSPPPGRRALVRPRSAFSPPWGEGSHVGVGALTKSQPIAAFAGRALDPLPIRDAMWCSRGATAGPPAASVSMATHPGQDQSPA
jgi:hypothetical protein